MSNISLSVRANTAANTVVPIEVVFGAVAGSGTGHAVWGGHWGPSWGLVLDCFVGLGWAGAVVWLAVIGVLQIRERFDIGLWSSSSPEAGRRRERESLFPKDMLNPAGTGRNDRTGQLVEGAGCRAIGIARQYTPRDDVETSQS